MMNLTHCGGQTVAATDVQLLRDKRKFWYNIYVIIIITINAPISREQGFRPYE
jgi:hypothetical protein